jgi:hypothetical protein
MLGHAIQDINALTILCLLGLRERAPKPHRKTLQPAVNGSTERYVQGSARAPPVPR